MSQDMYFGIYKGGLIATLDSSKKPDEYIPFVQVPEKIDRNFLLKTAQQLAKEFRDDAYFRNLPNNGEASYTHLTCGQILLFETMFRKALREKSQAKPQDQDLTGLFY
jgi:hypothetical protein